MIGTTISHISCLRTGQVSSTGCTPNLLMLGREVNLPVDLMFNTNQPSVPSCPSEYVEWVRDATRESFEFAKKNLKASAERQKKLYDIGKGFPKYKVGTWVWRFLPARDKLSLTWQGPYLLIKRMTDVTYRIQKNPEAREIVIHVDNIKQYESVPPIPSWLTINGAEEIPQENVSQNEISQGVSDSEVEQYYDSVEIPVADPQDQNIEKGENEDRIENIEKEDIEVSQELLEPEISVPDRESIPIDSRKSKRVRKPVIKLDL